MAGSINKVILVGNLGKDPECRRTQSGDPVVNFNVATSEVWRDKTTGERKENTEWHRITVFNENLCKVAEQYLRKGSKVYIEGQLRTREYTDKDGTLRKVTEIVLARFRGEITLLDRQDRPAPEPDSYGTTRTRDDDDRDRASAIARGDTGTPSRPPLDDDIPF